MTINDIDLSVYGATLLSKTISNHEVIQVYDWLDGATTPFYLRNEQRYKDIRLRILIESGSVAKTEENVTALMQALRISALKFDNLDKRFACHFEGTVEPEQLTPTVWLLEVELKCYKTYLPEIMVMANAVASKSITSTGSIPSECKITVTPTVAIAEYAITGLSPLPIKIKNLFANKSHVIDGYSFRYMKDGANDIGNYNAFSWPVLPIGTTTILFSHTTANVMIQCFPKFS